MGIRGELDLQRTKGDCRTCGLADHLETPVKGDNRMPMNQLLEGKSFDPKTIECISKAFENACRDLGLSGRDDSRRESVARKIIELVEQGECDAEDLRAQTVRAFRH